MYIIWGYSIFILNESNEPSYICLQVKILGCVSASHADINIYIQWKELSDILLSATTKFKGRIEFHCSHYFYFTDFYCEIYGYLMKFWLLSRRSKTYNVKYIHQGQKILFTTSSILDRCIFFRGVCILIYPKYVFKL